MKIKITTDEKTIRPFYCGTQYADWKDRNCDRCSKRNWKDIDKTCELDRDLSHASIADGKISEKIAKRIGFTKWFYLWDCPEREKNK